MAYRPPAAEQLRVGAVLDDLSVVEHDDPLGMPHARETMRDQDRRQPARQLEEAVEQLGFGTDVEMRRGLVENEHRRASFDGVHRSRECDPLPLATGQVDAAEVARERRVDALGQAVDRVTRHGLLDRATEGIG